MLWSSSPTTQRLRCSLRERVDEFELRGVRVLIFVHHDVTIFRAAGFERVGMLAEQPQREQNQIVEIHGVAGVQRGFVTLGECARASARTLSIAESRRVFAAVLELAQHRQHRAGIGLLALGGNVREDFFDRAELLRFVVDDEIAFVAQFLDVLAQNADAERMEGADGRAVRLCASESGFRRSGSSLRDALLHFARGLVGERDAEDVSRRNAALDHVRDAEGDDARLARARARQDQHRAVMVSAARRCCGLSVFKFNMGAEFSLPRSEGKRAAAIVSRIGKICPAEIIAPGGRKVLPLCGRKCLN